VDENIDLEAHAKYIGLVYIRAKYETLIQVSSLINLAKEKGLSLKEVECIIADWLSAVEGIYQDLICNEALFSYYKDAIKLVEKLKKKTKAKA